MLFNVLWKNDYTQGNIGNGAGRVRIFEVILVDVFFLVFYDFGVDVVFLVTKLNILQSNNLF